MPNLNFTEASIKALAPAKPGARDVYHDTGGRESVAGLSLRVTSAGSKSFSVFRRPAGGQPERLTLGRWPAISVDAARRLAKEKLALLAQGESPAASKRAERERSMTLAEALAEYVKEKRRADGLSLKPRTMADYLALLKPGRMTAVGTVTRGGMLCPLASKPIREITAADIRALHKGNVQRGERQAGYAMQVLRGVLNWHGVQVPNSPFSKETHGRDRIHVHTGNCSGTALTPEQIAIWWAALPDDLTGDYFRFVLLTGCRPAEPLKLHVGDVDLAAGKAVIRDTKNRSDHTIYLSTQALGIMQRQCAGKAENEKVFNLNKMQVFKASHELEKITGLTVQPRMLRTTFASIAEPLVSAYTLKCLMNHRQKSDITGTHYVRKTESELREGWQKVADAITN